MPITKGQLPKIFIASSIESIEIARALQQNLQRDAEVTIWDQDVFLLSRFSMESLTNALSQNDFGVFVFGPDDQVTTRGESQYVPRDNVILEMGMFIGGLGRSRVFFMKPKSVDLKLPSDLVGLNYAEYDDERTDKNLVAGTAVAANQIRQSVRVTHNFSTSISQSYNLSSTQVGAVCYKFVGEQMMIRLISTSSHRYTIPKGWVRDDESILDALTRICREEAGISGIPSDHLITQIKHRKYGQNRDLSIAVFPFSATAESQPLQRFRLPGWHNLDEAEMLLVSGRNLKDAEEYRRLLQQSKKIIQRFPEGT